MTYMEYTIGKSNDKNNINSRSEHLRNTTDTVKEIAEQFINSKNLTVLMQLGF